MKIYGLLKTKLIICMLITLTNISLGSKAQNLKIGGNVQLGYVNGYTELYRTSSYEYLKNVTYQRFEYEDLTFYSKVNFHFNYKKWLTVYQFTDVIFEYEDGYSFTPKNVEWLIGIKFNLFSNVISLGYEHSCLHPVYISRQKLDMGFMSTAYNRLYVQFNFGN